jgi:hypothetical protein
MHVIWGLVMLGVLARRAGPGVVAALGVVFGLYYTGLALYIAQFGSPFGLHVDASQNTFHFVVGPLALALGLWATFTLLHAQSQRGA